MARRVKAARLGGAHEGHFERSRGRHGGIMRWPLNTYETYNAVTA